MLSRSFDAERLNWIVNHPTVRPFVGGNTFEPLDLTHLVADEKNYALLGDHGGFLCTWTAPGTYEVHTFILPEGRGKPAYRLAKEGVSFMADIGAEHLWTRVPRALEHVRRFTLAASFKPCGSQELDLGIGPVTYDLFNWKSSTCP